MTELPPADRPFEESLAELEQVVRDLEGGSPALGLDDALARYERGVALVKHCHARLQEAEQRILLVTKVEADGQPALQPFWHEATARVRSASRRVHPGGPDGGDEPRRSP
jgi:exodeoxyribonuclease VII small subunit